MPRTLAKAQTRTHIVIPDTQQKSGVPSIHLEWISQYIADEYDKANLTVIHLGDHWDMPSLSSYDKGKKAMEGRRYVKDIDAGNAAFHKLHDGFAHIAARRVFLLGNHENRITRAAESDAQLDGIVTLDHLDTCGWEVIPFLQPLEINGVAYCHYFYNPLSGRPYGGSSIDTRLKTIGFSFVQGHQQVFMSGVRHLVNGKRIRGVVSGVCYLQAEDYLGPQGNIQKPHILVFHEVDRGDFDLMEVSLDYLARRYEGKRLSAVRWRK